MNHVGNRHVAAELRPQSDAVLRDYIRQNGTYQAEELLRSAYVAIGDPQAGVNFMLELASIAPEPKGVLELLVESNWIPAKLRNPVYAQIIAHAQDRLRNTEGISRQYAEEDLRSWQARYAMHLVEEKEFDQAATVLQPHDPPTATELEVRYRIALANDQFDAIVEQYRSNPDKAPQPEVSRQVATALQKGGQRAAARKLLELLFTQEIAAHQLSSANMLGLAEIRLQDGDTAGAMELLRRLALVVGPPFENLEPAASLLSRNGHHAEAVEFLAQLVKAKPWDDSARLRLAQEQIAAEQDPVAARTLAIAVASDSKGTYSDRLAAAAALSGTGPTLGSGELDFVAYGSGTADKPYFYTARLNAAKKAPPETAVQLLQNALSDAPHQDAVRAPLFYALAGLKLDRLALASVQPLLRNGYLQRVSRSYSGYNDQSSEPEDSTAEGPDATDNGEPTVVPLQTPATERAALAVAVADSYARLGELESARQDYRLALNLETSKVPQADIRKKISSVQAAIRRKANNELRMPVIHNDLEQEHTVRPRLLSAVKSPPAKPVRSTKGGRAQ
jgi:hypothetical protein